MIELHWAWIVGVLMIGYGLGVFSVGILLGIRERDDDEVSGN